MSKPEPGYYWLSYKPGLGTNEKFIGYICKDGSMIRTGSDIDYDLEFYDVLAKIEEPQIDTNRF